MKETRTIPDESITAAFQLSQCFRCRAVAYDFAGLITYNEHERCTDALMRHHNRTSARVCAHVHGSDSQGRQGSFQRPRPKCCRSKTFPGGARPLEATLMGALQDYKTSFHFMPLPKSFGSSWNSSRNIQSFRVFIHFASQRKGQR